MQTILAYLRDVSPFQADFASYLRGISKRVGSLFVAKSNCSSILDSELKSREKIRHRKAMSHSRSIIVEEKGGLNTVLTRSFYDRNTIIVACELLGRLVTVRRNKRRVARIVETEAYVGSDPANHAFRGQTRRNRSMFKDPGTLYVYTVHAQNCMNAVTRRGEAVLIRAAEPIENVWERTSGPGLLCRAMGITRKDDGKSLLQCEISIVDDGYRPTSIASSPRIGVTKWRYRHLRFFIKDNPFVSKRMRQSRLKCWPYNSSAGPLHEGHQ